MKKRNADLWGLRFCPFLLTMDFFNDILVLDRMCLEKGRVTMSKFSVRPLMISELPMLTKLFHYNDVQAMIDETAKSIKQGDIDIFGLFKSSKLIGELRAMYQSEEEDKVTPEKRAYLYAFRIHEHYQGKGFGKYLAGQVIDRLAEKGYSELTIGVEDDNERAIHIYKQFGFNELVARKHEEYEGYGYEYNLYLKRL